MKVLTNNKYYSQIADVIREQNGTSNTYTPPQMVRALKDLFYEEVEGVPPITFQGIGENLLDYRIDGASGGVGDRTGNLVDKTKFVYKYRLNNIGALYTAPSEQNLFAVSEFIEVNSGEQYIISQRDATRGYARRISFYQSKNENSWLSNNDDSDLIFTVPNTATYLRFTTLQNYIDSIMLIRGTSLPTTYEPYGYKVPVVCGGTTTNIYLDEPIDGRANIPSEYEEVEYIESTGTQYINTNIIPTDTTGVEAKISICNNNNRDNVFIGCREMGTSESRYWIDVDWTGIDTIIFGFNGNTKTNDRYSLKGSDVGKSFIISMNYMNDRTGKVNGITYDTSISSKTLVSISKPMYIFAGNRSGDAAYQYSGKLYNLKITDGTNVIKNFVPCYRKSDNVAGLYDLVNSTFYTNQGTGNFIVGPIKENESISLSDTNVNIPTIRGTNVLTVDTTVQPSNVYVKARKESQYETAMRQRYEEAQAQLDALESGGE